MNTRCMQMLILFGLAWAVAGCHRSSTKGDGAPQRSGSDDEQETYTVERTDYRPPKNTTALVDDRLEDKQTEFDPTLVHPLPLDGWLVNLSDAVIRLDVPLIEPDHQQRLLDLHPSYAAAIEAHGGYPDVLPSVNMVDGKAKQFDDGLYAALDQAYFQGLAPKLHSHVQVVQRIYDKVGPDSVAAPFLAAGLELAGVEVAVTDETEKERWLAKFHADGVASKPIGFYTWNESLRRCFLFLRFFQYPFDDDKLDVPRAIADALAEDEQLRSDVAAVGQFYAGLTNPLQCLMVTDLIGVESVDADSLASLSKRLGRPHATVALFPPSSSKEGRLFERMYMFGMPPNADLMREFIKRIRSGEIDLTPGDKSGWYDHQVYALETLLLPERGAEHSKLLMTKAYKKRMLEAFKALMTKRRETHVRQLYMDAAESAAAEPGERPREIAPRLRVEPAATYYLRTARAYAFLANFLETALGEPALRKLHGLRREGTRDDDLWTELQAMQQLFYGLYLISCEDVGLRPNLAADEKIDRAACRQAAGDWLADCQHDADLAVDTRVGVPILYDPWREETHVWLTLGVRLTRLETRFERAPSIKPVDGDFPWEQVGEDELAGQDYVIPVDVYTSVTLHGRTALTRDELRKICDEHRTQEAIIAALKRR